MPKCLDCGNEGSFYIASVVWDKMYYSDGDLYDVKSVDSYAILDDPDYAPECGDCYSKNVEGPW